jgi:hypothetical protein
MRYLVFAVTQGGFGLYTANRFSVDGDTVVMSDPRAEFGTGGLGMSRETYDRYFRGVPTTREYPTSVIIADGRIPLATFERAIDGLLGRTPAIAPPTTGSAGLR